MKVVILTRPDFRSPKILADSLRAHLLSLGVQCEVITDIHLLTVMVGYKHSGLSFHFWLRRRIKAAFKLFSFVRKLRKFDAIVESECIPNAYWRQLYDIEWLKKQTGRPVYLYEVYYLANAPSMISRLQNEQQPGLSRYDGHLYVSPITEVRSKSPINGFFVGLYSSCWKLMPGLKRKTVAIVDFLQPGYEHYREVQIRVLQAKGIPYISLERRYSIDEIRELYQQASILFIQFPEAFGLPILECLSYGVQIFTPDSYWPMSWRLNAEPLPGEAGVLPSCFTVYQDEADLSTQLDLFVANYHKDQTPVNVCNTFTQHYPYLVGGNDGEVMDFVASINAAKSKMS